jgi:thioredoxin 1
MQEVTDQSFEQDVLNSDQPVLVDFWAEWCAPCKALTPVIEQIAQQYEGRARFVKMNVDDHNQVATKFNVRGLPTLIVFKNGAEAERVTGMKSKENISQMIERALGA